MALKGNGVYVILFTCLFLSPMTSYGQMPDVGALLGDFLKANPKIQDGMMTMFASLLPFLSSTGIDLSVVIGLLPAFFDRTSSFLATPEVIDVVRVISAELAKVNKTGILFDTPQNFLTGYLSRVDYYEIISRVLTRPNVTYLPPLKKEIHDHFISWAVNGLPILLKNSLFLKVKNITIEEFNNLNTTGLSATSDDMYVKGFIARLDQYELLRRILTSKEAQQLVPLKREIYNNLVSWMLYYIPRFLRSPPVSAILNITYDEINILKTDNFNQSDFSEYADDVITNFNYRRALWRIYSDPSIEKFWPIRKCISDPLLSWGFSVLPSFIDTRWLKSIPSIMLWEVNNVNISGLDANDTSLFVKEFFARVDYKSVLRKILFHKHSPNFRQKGTFSQISALILDTAPFLLGNDDFIAIMDNIMQRSIHTGDGPPPSIPVAAYVRLAQSVLGAVHPEDYFHPEQRESHNVGCYSDSVAVLSGLFRESSWAIKSKMTISYSVCIE